MDRVRFTRVAEDDFASLPFPVKVRSVRILESVLSEVPLSGTEVVFEGVPMRMFPIRPFPYLILYTLVDDVLWVNRFLHGKMNWKRK